MIEFFAQTTGPVESWIGPLSGAGLAGVMLYWFMIRAEKIMISLGKRMDGNENAHNRTTRAILLLVLSLNQHNKGGPFQDEAHKLNKEVDESERLRGVGREQEEDDLSGR